MALMPRTLAQLQTSFWSEQSIRALPRDAQRAYLLVHSQPELSRCGVLPFRLRRLAQLSVDDTPKALRKAFTVLEKGRHLIVDEDAEELLVRTYVRWDGLLAQPQVVAAMVQDYELIESQTIRTEFLRELRRIWDLPDLPDNQRKGLRLALGEHETDRYREKIGAALYPPMATAIEAGHVAAFDPASPAGCPAGWAAGCEQAHAGAPAPSPAPAPTPSPAPAAVAPPATADEARSGSTTPTLLDQHQADLGPLPTATLTALARHIASCVAEGATDEHVLTGLAEWRRRPQSKPGLLPHLIADAARVDPDPTHLSPEVRAWVERETAKRQKASTA